MTLLRILHRHLNEQKLSILLFLFVGTLSAVVNLGSFSLLWNILHLKYQIAVSCAYFISVVVHFAANRQFTFSDHTTAFLPQIQRYLVMLLTNYLITMLIIHIIVEILHFSPYVGIITAIGLTVSMNYTISKFWVFQTF